MSAAQTVSHMALKMTAQALPIHPPMFGLSSAEPFAAHMFGAQVDQLVWVHQTSAFANRLMSTWKTGEATAHTDPIWLRL